MGYNDGYGMSSLGLGLRPTPMVKRLLIANVVVFLVQVVGGPVVQAFLIDWFAFHPRGIVFRPWGPFTYMFLHAGLGHMVVNMLFLFFFGPPLEGKWGEREFLRFYVISGLGGALLSYAFLPATVIGASAAVYGVMLAFAMNWPNAPIYVFGIFPVLAKYLVAFMGIVSLLGAAGSAQGGNYGNVAHFAHLGGLIAAYLYLKSDWRASKALEGLQRSVRKKRSLAIVPRDDGEEESSGRSRGRRKIREDTALFDKVDAVLDKISAEGMESLTPEELKLLDEVSKKHRTN